MQSRIDTWAKKGGKKEKLWDSVKGADRREGVVVRIEDDDANSCRGESRDGHLKPSKPAKSKGIREKERLSKLLEQIAQMSNELKKGMEVLAMREKLLEMAGDRAENVRQCGWDQRLCYEDEEWAANGQSVLESYDDRDMDVDGQSDSGDADWWCSEDTGCSRHMG
jgi:COMPASS component SPP1